MMLSSELMGGSTEIAQVILQRRGSAVCIRLSWLTCIPSGDGLRHGLAAHPSVQ